MDRVEQEHQEVRRLLEQLQRDNVARVQAMQNTIDERILNLTQLRDRMQQGGQKSLGQDLQQKLSELLPRELTLSLKRVSFQPNPNLPSLFGKIRVQEQSLRFSVSCGGQSRGACVSSMGVNQTQYRNGNAGEAADSQVTRHMPEKPVTSSGSVRVVRKIRISPRAEETGLSSSPQLPRVPAIDLSTLSDPNTHILGVGGDNDEDLGLFQAVPAFLSDGESENGEEEVAVENSMERNHVRDSPVSSRALILLSSRRPSARHEGGLERTSRCWGSVDSISCEGSYKGHGLTVNQHSTESGTQNDGTGPGKDKSNLTDVRSRQSQNTICDESKGIQAANRNNQSPPNVSKRDSRNRLLPNASPALRRGLNRIESTNVTRGFKNKNSTEFHCFSAPSSVCRSVSMSAIEVPSACSKQGNGRLKLKTFRSAREQKQGGRGEAEREAKTDQAELAIQEEDGERQDQVRLISKFGKFGSGRAELSLPSGVHAMPQGQLYVVDCGNARVQVTDTRGNILQQVSFQGHEGAAGRRCRNYFDVAVNGKGLIALSCAAEKALLIFSRHGRRLQAFGGGGDELEAPRGVAVNYHDEFLVADTRRGTLTAFKLDPKSGSKLERTVVPGFCKPYLVATGLATGLVAVSERGSETGGAPCVKVLGPNWNTLRILGIDTRLGPVLSCPWGVCIDRDGDVLVADWGKEHRVLLYSAQGSGRPVVTQGLNSPRGLTLLPEGHLVVADSMHNCIKIFQYK
ncbi:TRIM2 protein, partial [Amia calva]|nr:TRIM2 protein [Amia calva]